MGIDSRVFFSFPLRLLIATPPPFFEEFPWKIWTNNSEPYSLKPTWQNNVKPNIYKCFPAIKPCVHLIIAPERWIVLKMWTMHAVFFFQVPQTKLSAWSGYNLWSESMYSMRLGRSPLYKIPPWRHDVLWSRVELWPQHGPLYHFLRKNHYFSFT